MNIWVVNGYPGSGKTTFESIVKEMESPYIVDTYSTVDFVKDLAAKCGWDGTKTPRHRKFLSDLKDLLTEWNDVPLNKCKEYIERFKRDLARCEIDDKSAILFIDCREPKEIQRLVDECGAKTIFIRRAGEQEILNHADRDVEDFEYDWYIDNRGSLAELCKEARKFINEISLAQS